MSIRIILNKYKIENYNFIDYKQRLFLDLATPFKLCESLELTRDLKIAITSGKVIDVDNFFNIELTDKVKEINSQYLKSCGIIAKNISQEPVAEIPAVEEVVEEKETKEKKEKKKSKKKE